jgi:hypothetical protein
MKLRWQLRIEIAFGYVCSFFSKHYKNIYPPQNSINYLSLLQLTTISTTMTLFTKTGQRVKQVLVFWLLTIALTMPLHFVHAGIAKAETIV